MSHIREEADGEAGLTRLLDSARADFRNRQDIGLERAMGRVRLEAELKQRMGASMHDARTARRAGSWLTWRRGAVFAAASAAFVVAGVLATHRAPSPVSTGVQSLPAAVSDAGSLNAQIAAARPGQTLVLAKSATIEAAGAPLRISKPLRIVVERGSAQTN